MPETREEALKRATKHGFPRENVVATKKGDYYIAPHGIKEKALQRAYAEIRAKGNSKEKSAKIVWAMKNKKQGE